MYRTYNVSTSIIIIATIGNMKWDPEGLKIKAQKAFNYDNTHNEARKFIKKYLSRKFIVTITNSILRVNA
jgi:hypothetical protein